MPEQSPVLVVGAGSWGTALAILLGRNHHPTLLWGRDTVELAQIKQQRQNAYYLPGIEFPAALEICTDLLQALQRAEVILLAVPSCGFRDSLDRIAPHLLPQARICWATKGLEQGTCRLLSQVAESVLGPQRPLAVLSGPTFANEVARGLPTAITVAANRTDFAEQLVELLRGDNFRVYTSPDMVGVQLGGAAKNVIAIAAGIADGLGFGANTRAALVTRGLHEISRLGIALGGQPETFMGLTGLGDLTLTCTDNQSRNRRFGYALAQGKSVADAYAEIGQVVEGSHAAEQVLQLAQRIQVEMPITEQVYRVLQGHCTPLQAVHNLLSREPKSELA